MDVIPILVQLHWRRIVLQLNPYRVVSDKIGTPYILSVHYTVCIFVDE